MFGEGEEPGKEVEVVPAPASPLVERLRDFRDGVGEQPDEDKPGGGERVEGQDETQDEPVETEEEAGGEDKPTGEEAAEGDEPTGDEEPEAGEEELDAEGKPKGTAEQQFSIQIPTLNADGSRGPRGAGVLQLDGLPQEYRDTIQSHIKRSLQLDGVLQRLEQARELEVDALFFRRDPLNAMRLVAVEKPELAAKFVESWVVQNPTALKALLRTLKIDETDNEKLELRGKLARKDMEDELATAYGGIEKDTAKVDFTDRAHGIVDEITGSLALDDEGTADFQQLAGARIVAEMERRVAARQSPYLNETELLTVLQPLIEKFTGVPAKPKGKGKLDGKTGLTRDELAQRAKTADRFRQLRGPGTGAGVRPSGVKKTKLPRDLGERIKALRSGKL